MNKEQKKFLEEALGVKPKTAVVGSGDDQVKATKAFAQFCKREAAVKKQIADLRKAGGLKDELLNHCDAQVEAARERTKSAKKGDAADVKTKCEEAEDMLAVTEKALGVAVKSPQLAEVAEKHGTVDGYIAKLESNGTLAGGEITKARANIDKALDLGVKGKDDLDSELLKLQKAAKAAYELSKTAAENAKQDLESHADYPLVTKEAAAVKTDLLDKADQAAADEDWAAGKKLYDEATAAFGNMKGMTQKMDATVLRYYKSALAELGRIKANPLKDDFTEEIAVIEKRLEAARTAVLQGKDPLVADRQVDLVRSDCANCTGNMLSHGRYLDKRLNNFDPKKNALPPNSDADFGEEVKAIEKLVAGGNKRADRRDYTPANTHLDAAISACDELQKLVDVRTAYLTDLKQVQTAVDTLPGDDDKLIGGESKAVRAQLEAVAKLAAAKDFKTAQERLPEVQNACDAAKQVAAKFAAAKDEGDVAVGKDDPSESLAEVNKMYEKLKNHDEKATIAEQLKSIKTKLEQAETALKA
jgi:hypothetical protein